MPITATSIRKALLITFISQLEDDGMMYIYLQDRLSARNCLSGRFQEALQVGIHIIFTNDEAGRGSRQARCQAYFFDLLIEYRLETFKQFLRLTCRFLLLLFLLLL